jgi:energy-coupling factor transporter ATP-binding protein EcfA2
MKILNLKISNFLGISEANLNIKKKCQFFIGENGSGKSSLASAFEYLASGFARSLTLKKDRNRLIRRGFGKTEVTVTLENDITLRRTTTQTGESFRAIINNKETSEFPFDFNVSALNPFLFFEKSIEERKSMLFGLFAGESDVNVIMDKLTERGVSEQTTKEIAMQVIENGFAATQADVIEERKSLKREREALKETASFDPVLNAGWRIDDGEYTLTDYTVEQLTEALGALEGAKSGLLIEKGKISNAVAKSQVQTELDQVITILTQAEADHGELKDPAPFKASLKEITAELDKLNTDIAAARATKNLMVENLNLQVPNLDFEKCPVMEGLRCPVPDKDRKKVKTVFEDKKKRAEQVTDEANAAIAELMKQQQVKTKEGSEIVERIQEMEGAIENARRKVLSLRTKKTELEKKLETAVDTVGDTAKLNAEIEELTYRTSVGRQLIRAVENYHVQKAAFDKAGPTITEKDEAIKSCDILDKALSPNGIPAELTQDAMGAFKARIQHTSKIFGVSVDVNPDDYLPLWNGNHYNLLSTSEQWRARFFVQEAVAYLAKTPWLIVDEAALLDFKNRAYLFDIVFEIADNYDFVAIFATQNDEKIPVIDHPLLDFWEVKDGRVSLLKPPADQLAAQVGDMLKQAEAQAV